MVMHQIPDTRSLVLEQLDVEMLECWERLQNRSRIFGSVGASSCSNVISVCYALETISYHKTTILIHTLVEHIFNILLKLGYLAKLRSNRPALDKHSRNANFVSVCHPIPSPLANLISYLADNIIQSCVARIINRLFELRNFPWKCPLQRW